MEGIIPALIQIPIKAPINMKIKIGIIATLIPSLIPFWISCQLKPRNFAQKVSKSTVNKTGTSGDKPNLITDNPKMTNKTIRIIIDSEKGTFFFSIFIPPNKKIPLT